jgi:hypothetical protein
MKSKNNLPGFSAAASLFGASEGIDFVESGWYGRNKLAITAQAVCFTQSNCNGIFKICTTCCIEAVAGGTIDHYCYPSRICGVCKKLPILIT